MSNDLSAFFGGAAFVPAQHEAATDIDVYPPGKYPVLIKKAEVRETKKGNGHFIALELQILDGPHKGRILFDNINIDNPSEQCVEIGMRTFSALGRAIGLQAITNTDQLLNQIVVAHVKVKDNQNNVRTYSGSTAPPVAPTTVPSPPTSPVASPAINPEPTPLPLWQGEQRPVPSQKPPWER